MRWIVVGAGAVGGLVGGRLIGSGEEVVMIARGAHADAIEERGLEVVSPSGSRTYRPASLRRPAEGVELRGGDVALLCVKSQDTSEALGALRGETGDEVSIICMQNGVENEEWVAQRFARVVGAMVWTPAVYLEPGVVRSFAERDVLLRCGEWPKGDGARVQEVAAALARAGLDAETVPDVASWKRGKLLTNLGNALDAFVSDGGRELRREVVAEGEAALQAAGMAYMPAGDLIRYCNTRLPELSVSGARRPGGSTWQSLARGAGSVEVASLNGYVSRLAGLHGVPAPLNRTLAEVAPSFERGERPPRSLSVDEVRALAEA